MSEAAAPPPAGAVAQAPKRRTPLFEREAPFGYALVLPAIIYLSIFIAWPFGMAIWLSLSDAQAGSQESHFVGLDNYTKVDHYDLLANDFVLAKGTPAEIAALVAAKGEAKVVTAPAGARFRASIVLAGRTIPFVEMEGESDATYAATTALEELAWEQRASGASEASLVLHSPDSPLSLGSFPDKKSVENARKADLLVPAEIQVKSNGTGVAEDPNFLLAVKNTLKYTFGTEFVKLFFGIPCALILNRKFRGRKILRGLLVVPWVIPIAISGQAWLWILDSSYSIINWSLIHLHIITPQNILNFRGDKDLAMISLIVVNVWRGFPFTTVVILAGLTSIPDEILERARLDGANGLQRFIHIIAPMVRPILMVSLLFSVVFSFTDFNTIWIITKGGPYDQTQVLATYAYQVGVNAGFLNKGAAISLFLFPIMAVTVFGMLQFLRRENM